MIYFILFILQLFGIVTSIFAILALVSSEKLRNMDSELLTYSDADSQPASSRLLAFMGFFSIFYNGIVSVVRILYLRSYLKKNFVAYALIVSKFNV